eukprot:COSAG06_NODE_4880_length_3886_cov_3.018748_1_plen_195_part_10
MQDFQGDARWPGGDGQAATWVVDHQRGLHVSGSEWLRSCDGSAQGSVASAAADCTAPRYVGSAGGSCADIVWLIRRRSAEREAGVCSIDRRIIWVLRCRASVEREAGVCRINRWSIWVLRGGGSINRRIIWVLRCGGSVEREAGVYRINRWVIWVLRCGGSINRRIIWVLRCRASVEREAGVCRINRWSIWDLRC